MWNVNPDRDMSHGGFQNADLGRTQFDKNYGPEFGVDYARFSDPPDVAKDFHLKTLIEQLLSINEQFRDISPTVRNGFIILKGNVLEEKIRLKVLDFVRTIPGVVEVINQISVNEQH